MARKEIRPPTDSVAKAIQALATLAALGDDASKHDKAWTSTDVEVERNGKKIILPNDPAPMSYDAGIEALQRRKEEENVEYDVTEFIPGAFWDAGLAFYKAMQRTYGWVATRGIQTMFGEMKPNLVSIRTGPMPDDVLQLPIGEFTVPNISNAINARPFKLGSTPGFLVSSTCRRAEQTFLVELCNLAREILRLESIYRGQAVRLFVDSEGDLNFGTEPEFMDLRWTSKADLIFNDDTQRLIQTNLFTPIEKTSVCRQHRIPLKRTILMEGPYGCGKSLTSKVTAKVAADADWTFIALDDVRGLRQAIEFARLYQPAVIFAEDIDRMGDRTSGKVNELINMLDGVLTKDVEIMVVLTTNHIEKIDQAFLRPGRFDAVIRIDAPDEQAVGRLFRYYGRELIAVDADLSEAAEELRGQIPATIREVVERAKLSMVLDEGDHLEPMHLKTAAVGMRRHLELLAPKALVASAGERMAAALREVLAGQVSGGGTDPVVMDFLQALVSRSDRITKEVLDTKEKTNVAIAHAATASGNAKKVLDDMKNGLSQRIASDVADRL